MMEYLEAQNLRFSRSGTALRMTISGRVSYTRVEIVKAFPHSYPDEYVWVGDGSQGIGMLRDINELDPDSRGAVEQEIERRYFMPVIEKVSRISSKKGSMSWDVVTDKGEVSFQTKGLQDCLTEIGGKTILTDIAGNRYYLKPAVRRLL
jgi:hypothetical protein